jgi:hypothetical protein
MERSTERVVALTLSDKNFISSCDRKKATIASSTFQS